MNKSVLITGIAGSGKSSVCRELQKRGYAAHDIEDMEGLFVMINRKTGNVVDKRDNNNLELVKQADWICNKNKLQELMDKNAEGAVFYCGTASNLDQLLPLFDGVFLLSASLKNLRERLSTRNLNEFGRTGEVQNWILGLKDSWEDRVTEKGAEVIDADQNVKEVVTEILGRVCVG